MSNYDGFGKIIKQLRLEKKLSCQQLALGLCDESTLRKYEEGTRNLNIFVRTRLLERLGEDNLNFEFFVNKSEYKEWQARQRVLNAYKNNTSQLSNELLSFNKNYGAKNSLSSQFHLEFSAFALLSKNRLTNKDRKICRECLQQAIKKTIVITNNKIQNIALSPEEINLLIEYSLCSNPNEAYSQMIELYNFVQLHYDNSETAIIIQPKIVYCMTLIAEKTNFLTAKSIDLYNIVINTINQITNAGKTYYLAELINWLSNCHSDTPNHYTNWSILLNKIKNLSNEEICTNDNSFLFQHITLIYIGDIIKQRRTMYSLTMEELSKEICDIKTLSRIENSKTEGQQQIITKLLDKLKLTSVLQKGNALFENLQTYRKEESFRYYVGSSSKDYSSAEVILSELKEELDLSNVYNLQYILSREASLNYRQHIISAEQYFNELLTALELTLNLSTINTSATSIMSHAEINCCYNIALLPVNNNKKDTIAQCLLSVANKPETQDIKTREMALIASGRYYIENKNPQKAFDYYQALLDVEISNYRTYLIFFALSMMKTCNELRDEPDQNIKNSIDYILTSYYNYMKK